jgi:hypothetical protein
MLFGPSMKKYHLSVEKTPFNFVDGQNPWLLLLCLFVLICLTHCGYKIDTDPIKTQELWLSTKTIWHAYFVWAPYFLIETVYISWRCGWVFVAVYVTSAAASCRLLIDRRQWVLLRFMQSLSIDVTQRHCTLLSDATGMIHESWPWCVWSGSKLALTDYAGWAGSKQPQSCISWLWTSGTYIRNVNLIKTLQFSISKFFCFLSFY